MAIAGVIGGLKYLPASLGVKALQKVNPKFKNYFANAASYGIDANRALDFIVNKFESQSQQDYKSQLEKGAAQNTLRPDEQVSRSNIKNAEMPLNALKGAASLAIGGALGGVGLDQAEQRPEMQQNQDQQSQQTEQDPFSFISSYSPELAKRIKMNINLGISPIETARAAADVPALRSSIEQIEKDTRMDFISFMQKLFGQESKTALQRPKEQPQQQVTPTGSSRVQQFNQLMSSLRNK